MQIDSVWPVVWRGVAISSLTGALEFGAVHGVGLLAAALDVFVESWEQRTRLIRLGVFPTMERAGRHRQRQGMGGLVSGWWVLQCDWS